MIRLWSALSLVGGRSLAPVRGRKLKEGAMAAFSTSVLSVGRASIVVENGRIADESRNYYDSYNCGNMRVCVGVRMATRENKRKRNVSTFTHSVN
jgi:hypothetical protein